MFLRQRIPIDGTSSLQLDSGDIGYPLFVARVGLGVTCDYVIVSNDRTQYEKGEGSFTAGGLFARTTITASSNANAIVNFGAGSHAVHIEEQIATSSGGWLGVVRPEDQTKVSDNAFANDTYLNFAIAANQVSAFIFNVHWHQESAAPDIKLTINGPTGPTRVNYWIEYQQPSGGNVTSFVTATAYGTSHALVTGTVATNTVGVARIQGFVQNGSTAGTVALQWAQNTLSADDLTLLAGSSLRYMHAA